MTVQLQVDVEFDDVVKALSDEQIAEIVSSSSDTAGTRDVVRRAISAIQVGRYDDAIVALEREFFPKWKDHNQCRDAYNEAMGRA